MNIKFMEVDHLAGTCKFWLENGEVLLADGITMPSSPIKLSRMIPGEPVLALVTNADEQLNFELPTVTEASPLRGRPVIYLDQNAWSKIATSLHDPDRLPREEVEAALWLVDLVRNWKIVLPFSAGTLSETSHWSDHDRRYQLGLTVCELSRGWQMLDPLEVRAAEMRWILAQADGTPGHELPTVWTLAPNAVFGTRIDPIGSEPEDNFDAESLMHLQATVAISSIVATMLDSDSTTRNDPEAWANKWMKLANHLRDTNRSKQVTRDAVHVSVLTDATTELSNAAVAVSMTAEAFGEWLRNSSKDDIAQMPAMGMAREVTHLKISNAQAQWKPNDLTDIFYMVQASGYADAVVGERGFASLARSAQKRLGRRENVYSSLATLRRSGLLDTIK